jgi:hypothetical protein
MHGDTFTGDDIDVIERVLDMFPYAPVLAFFGVRVQALLDKGSLSFPVERFEDLESLFGDVGELTFRGHRYRADDARRHVPAEAFPLRTMDQVLTAARVALGLSEREQLSLLAERQRKGSVPELPVRIGYALRSDQPAGSVWMPSRPSQQGE